MKTMRLRDRTISTVNAAFVMGIVNATPDSFWGASRGGAERALRLIDEGADIIDIGGESTRPGSADVDEDEEIRRILPVIRAVRARSSVPISVDTRKKTVMEAAFREGADILNDVSALGDDGRMAAFCAETGIPVILMHGRGTPAHGFAEIDEYLRNRCGHALKNGIKKDRIWIDPGIGFGKDADCCFALMRDCGKLCGGGYPVLMALSRKSCIGAATGRGADERLAGTIAADLLSVMGGASMIRVHDVAEAVDSLSIYGRVRGL